MEGINKTLYTHVNHELKKYFQYRNLPDEIKDFLELKPNEYKQRQEVAKEISKQLLRPHLKENLVDISMNLADLERKLLDIQEYQRDHVCHALLTFLLGFIIINKYDLEGKYSDFLFQWKLSALLHDVGYPLEITDNLNNDYFTGFEKDVLGEEPDFNPIGGQYLKKYLKLYNKNKYQKRNSLDYFSQRVNDWKINIDVKKIFEKMSNGEVFDNRNKRSDHGITSAILVMKAIDKLYEQENPNQERNRDTFCFYNLENHINDACTSIFLHNINSDTLEWDFNIAPLATLLKICDELQDWGRPKKEAPGGNSPLDYDFEFDENVFVFKVIDEKIGEIKNNISKVKNFPIRVENLKK